MLEQFNLSTIFVDNREVQVRSLLLKYTTKQCTCQVKLIYLFMYNFKNIYKLRLHKVPVRAKLVFWTYQLNVKKMYPQISYLQ